MESKKIADLEKVELLEKEDLILVETRNGTRTIKKEALLESIVSDCGIFHNSIYRGWYLGTSHNTENYSLISDGTFKYMHIGDYWAIGGLNYRFRHLTTTLTVVIRTAPLTMWLSYLTPVYTPMQWTITTWLPVGM